MRECVSYLDELFLSYPGLKTNDIKKNKIFSPNKQKQKNKSESSENASSSTKTTRVTSF